MKSQSFLERESDDREEDFTPQQVRARKNLAKYITIQLAKDFLELDIKGRMHPPEVYKDADIAAVFGLKNERNTGTWVDIFQTAVDTSGAKNRRNLRGEVTYGAWCASFLQWILVTAERRVGLKEPTPIYPSKLVMEMWEESKDAQLEWFVKDSAGRKVPRRAKIGWIAVWRRTPKVGFTERTEERERGHAELVIEDSDSNFITTIGGNTTDVPDGQDASDGNKVALHVKHDPRTFGSRAKDYSYDFLGYLAPWGTEI